MFKHILVPVDGSHAAGQAVEKALAVARAFGSDVTIVYVIDPYAFSGVGTDFSYGQAEYLEAASAEAKESIAVARQVFEGTDVPVNSSVVEGHAIYRGILDAAKSVHADLLVMGSHGRRGLEKLVLGSVVAQVLSHTDLPVLVVRE